MKFLLFFYDKYKGKIEDNSRFIKIKDTEDLNQDNQMLVEKKELRKDNVFRLIATITFLCKFKKIKSIEDTIKKLIMECGFSKHKAEDDYETIQELPITKEKKLTTVITLKKETKEIFAFTKGNPLTLLKKCTKTTINGKKTELDNQARRKIRKRVKQLNKNGQKVIAFAYKPLPLKRLDRYTESFAETDMTFLGVMGVTNPLKAGLEESIDLIKKAGIKTYILSSVKERKAAAIGRIQKLINPQYFESISGDYFRQLSDQKISKMLENKEKDYIFAELKEKDKERIINLLRKQGQTVAVIDRNRKNNLNNIVQGIKKGRITTRNNWKYSHHAIACKTAEFILILTALILKAPTPLSIALILGIDLAINTILELSLRVSRVEEDVMSRKYHPEKIRILNKKLLPGLIINSISIGIILSIIYILSLIRYGWNIGEDLEYSSSAFAKAATITIILLITIQIINAFSLRTRKKSIFQLSLLSNPFLILTSIISLLVIHTATTFSIFKDYLHLESLSGLEWQIIFFCTLIFLVIDEFRKTFLRNTP